VQVADFAALGEPAFGAAGEAAADANRSGTLAGASCQAKVDSAPTQDWISPTAMWGHSPWTQPPPGPGASSEAMVTAAGIGDKPAGEPFEISPTIPFVPLEAPPTISPTMPFIPLEAPPTISPTMAFVPAEVPGGHVDPEASSAVRAARATAAGEQQLTPLKGQALSREELELPPLERTKPGAALPPSPDPVSDADSEELNPEPQKAEAEAGSDQEEHRRWQQERKWLRHKRSLLKEESRREAKAAKVHKKLHSRSLSSLAGSEGDDDAAMFGGFTGMQSRPKILRGVVASR